MSQDLLTQLAEYGTYCDEQQGSVSADDVIDAVVPLPMPTPQPAPRRGWLVAVAAAALILIVIGGVTWLTPLGDSIAPTDEPTETTISQTTVPETTVPNTTLPAGPVEVTVEWTEVTEGNPPYTGPIDKALGEPFIIDDGTTQRAAIVSGTDDTSYSLWTSEDGVRWEKTSIALPDDAGDLKVTPSGYWLVGPELWFSPDLVSGREAINLDGLTRRELYPLTGEPRIQGVAALGDTTLIAVQYTWVFDWDQLLGIEPGTYDEYDYDYDGDEESTENRQSEQLDPVITLSGRVHEPEDRSDTLLRFIPLASADGLTIADADSGETLFEFSNYDAFDWEDVVGQEAWPRFETESSTLLAVTPDGVEEVSPWSSGIGTSPSPDSIRLIELNDAVIVVGRSQPGESYLTRDGASFQAISLPDPTVQYDQASGYLYTPYVDPSYGMEHHWISPDGINWTPLDTIPGLDYNVGPDVSTLSRVAGGWLFIKYASDRIDASYFSLDAEEWHVSDHLATVERDFGTPLTWGNRLLIFGEDSNWVGTVDIAGG